VMLMVSDVHVLGFSMLEKKPEMCLFCRGEADSCPFQRGSVSMLVDVGYGCFVLSCFDIAEIMVCAECEWRWQRKAHRM